MPSARARGLQQNSPVLVQRRVYKKDLRRSNWPSRSLTVIGFGARWCSFVTICHRLAVVFEIGLPLLRRRLRDCLRKSPVSELSDRAGVAGGADRAGGRRPAVLHGRARRRVRPPRRQSRLPQRRLLGARAGARSHERLRAVRAERLRQVERLAYRRRRRGQILGRPSKLFTDVLVYKI